MQQIIITTPEELETLIQKSFTNALSTHVPPVEQEEKFISLKQAALYLNLSPQTIYGLTSKRSIPFIKKGKKLRFLESELKQWLYLSNSPNNR